MNAVSGIDKQHRDFIWVFDKVLKKYFKTDDEVKKSTLARLDKHFFTYTTYFNTTSGFAILNYKLNQTYDILSNEDKLNHLLKDGKRDNKSEIRSILELVRSLEKDYRKAMLKVLKLKATFLSTKLDEKLSEVDITSDVKALVEAQKLKGVLTLSPIYRLGDTIHGTQNKLVATLKNNKNLELNNFTVDKLLSNFVTVYGYMDALLAKIDHTDVFQYLRGAQSTIHLFATLTSRGIEPYFDFTKQKGYIIKDSEGGKRLINSHFEEEAIESALFGVWYSDKSKQVLDIEINTSDVEFVNLY